MKLIVFIILLLLSSCKSLNNASISMEGGLKECHTPKETDEVCMPHDTLKMEAVWHFDKDGRIGYEWYEIKVENYTNTDIAIYPEFSVDTVAEGRRAMLFRSWNDRTIVVPHGEEQKCAITFKRNNKYRYRPLDREYILCLNYTVANDTMMQRLELPIERPAFWREGTYYMYEAYILQDGKVVHTSDGADRLIYPSEDPYADHIPTTQASFPGGRKAFETFFAANVNRPTDENGNPLRARVLIEFDVDAEGNICNIDAKRNFTPNGRPPHTELVEEAIRIAKLMPKWIPATEWGVPVCSRTNLQFRF